MFYCGACKQLTAPREPMTRRVVETRERIYPERTIRPVPGQPSRVIDPGGYGHETVREIGVCPRCAESSAATHRMDFIDAGAAFKIAAVREVVRPHGMKVRGLRVPDGAEVVAEQAT